MRITKDMARVVEHVTTPTGEPGILIECLCGNHPRGNRAILRECNTTPARIHGNIDCAWSAWSAAPSVKRHGPWAA